MSRNYKEFIIGGLSYEKFFSSFRPEATFVTHEFCYDRTMIHVGRYRNRLVALKESRGAPLAREADIHEALGSGSQHVVKFYARVIDEDERLREDEKLNYDEKLDEGESLNDERLDDYEQESHSVSILMEGVTNGLTLHNFLLASGQLSLPKCVNLLLQIIYGLQYIHSCGVLHHDLKLENIMVETRIDGNGQILKICDFGVSEFLDEKGRGSEK